MQNDTTTSFDSTPLTFGDAVATWLLQEWTPVEPYLGPQFDTQMEAYYADQ